MRNFRRLPPLLRVASILGLLFPLAALVLLGSELAIAILTSFPILTSIPRWQVDDHRVVGIVLDLVLLGGACTFAVIVYSVRFRRPDGGPFPLDSWRSQVRAIALLAALPLGALALALVPSPGFPADFLAIGITLLAAVVLLAAYVWAVAGAASI